MHMAVKNLNAADVKAVKQVLKGDKDKYALIVEAYEPKLLRYVQYLVKDADKAADIVQDTFIKAYINLRSFNLKKQFSPWIYRIAHNEAMNSIKKSKKTATFSDLEFDESHLVQEFATHHRLDKMFLKREVQQCLKDLPFKYKEVVALYFFEHLPYEAISDVLHIPVSTVGVRLSRAKKILKEVCTKRGVKHE